MRRRRSWRLPKLFIKRLEHSRGFFAARNAQIEPRFGLVGNHLGIVMAVVAALAAILLRHRRHHLAADRTALSKFHAFGDRHGLVVPRRFAIIAIAGSAVHDSCALLR
jgi:hypothetical protein